MTAGDVLTDHSGYRREVLRVRLFRAFGDEDGEVVTSGRDWLRRE